MHLRHLGFSIVNDSLYNGRDRLVLMDHVSREAAREALNRIEERVKRREQGGENVRTTVVESIFRARKGPRSAYIKFSFSYFQGKLLLLRAFPLPVYGVIDQLTVMLFPGRRPARTTSWPPEEEWLRGASASLYHAEDCLACEMGEAAFADLAAAARDASFMCLHAWKYSVGGKEFCAGMPR